MSDALKAIVENTQRFNGGVVIKKRFADIAYPQSETESRSASDIISHMKKKLEVGEN